AAAVSDWRVENPSAHKLKKDTPSPPLPRKREREKNAPVIMLTENPDILKSLATGKPRPKLVIGFAAETDDLENHAAGKRTKKGADWIVANDVSGGKVFGADANEVTLITVKGSERWPLMSKDGVAKELAQRIIA